MLLRGLAILICAGALTGCTDIPGDTRSGPGSGQLAPEDFPMRNARVTNQSGVNTAIVAVTRGVGSNGHHAVRVAAEQWCNSPAQVSRITSRPDHVQSYLVRCR